MTLYIKTFVATLFFCSLFLSCSGEEKKGRKRMSTEVLLDSVQYYHFQYFWDGAEPNSGLACERIHMDGVYPHNDAHIVTTGGSGFGLMALLVGVKRNFITTNAFIQRMEKIVSFLEKADRFHGAWPHWIDGETGKIKPFSKFDDGGDLVETAFLVQGLLTVQHYLRKQHIAPTLIQRIEKLWREVEWDWYTNGQDVLFWHWSPNFGWKMNFGVTGYNECLIMYVLAASSPTHPIKPSAYHNGWARSGQIKSDNQAYGLPLLVSHNAAKEYGGPLFWAHYSYLGLDPRYLKDDYVNYWDVNKNHAQINRLYCVKNPKKFKGYGENCWGLTSSYTFVPELRNTDSFQLYNGYKSHAPMKIDRGVITPTAALSSMPYLPEEVLPVMEYFYYDIGDKLLGKYGFYDAFSETEGWYPKKYLAIDQGPIPVMIENYRSAFLWELFMSISDVKKGLKKLGFTVKKEG